MTTLEHIRRRGLSPRRRLLHVLGYNRIDSMTMLCLELIQVMPDYAHTVVCQADPCNIDTTWMWTLQAAGAALLHTNWPGSGLLPGDLLENHEAMILYDTFAYGPHGSYIPTVHYRYSGEEAHESVDACIGPSEDIVLPPVIRSRTFGRVGRDKTSPKFTVAILCSDFESKYPTNLIQYFIDHMPDDMKLVISDPCKETLSINNKDVWKIPVMVDATLKGLQLADVAVYGRKEGYCSPHSRMCAEILASGVPLVCEQRGAPARLYKEGVEVLFFSGPEEAMGRVQELRGNKELRDTLKSNGQLAGSLQDIEMHLGKLRDVLRGVGV